MKYNLNINQKAVVKNGWDLRLEHLVILDAIVGMINSQKFKTKIDNDNLWYWVKVSKILDELPLLKIKERRCRNYISDLCECGLLEKNPNNKKLRTHYIKLGKNYAKYLFSGSNEEKDTMQDIAKPMAENCQGTMQNIANYNNTNNNTIDNNNVGLDENEEKEKTNKIDWDAFLQVFNEVTGRNFRTVNTKARTGYKKILDAGYTKKDIQNAIINCKASKYHRENPHHLTPEFISRIDKFEKYFDKGIEPDAQLPEDWINRQLTQEQEALLTKDQVERRRRNKGKIELEGGRLLPILEPHKQN